MKVWIFLLFSLFFKPTFSQDIQPEERLILSDSVVFMGIDFSTARFYNPEKVNLSGLIRDRHGPVWGQIDDYLAKGDLKYNFQKMYVKSMTALFDSSFKNLDSTWVIEDDYKGMTDSMIGAHVSSYSPTPGGRLGLVILIDQLNQVTKYATVCVVYLDLQNNKVIKVIRAEGIGSGYGYTSFWKTGVENAYHDFISKDDKYLKLLRKSFK